MEADRRTIELRMCRRVHETERRVGKAIMEFGVRTWNWPLIQTAFRQFAPWKESSALLLKALPVFDRWLAFTWIPRLDDDFEAPKSWPTAPLGVAWLASGAADVDNFAQALILKAAESPYSALQVEAMEPGWCLAVRDLLTGRRLRVVDPEVSARARVDDILFSAVVTLDGMSALLGTATFTLPPDSRVHLLSLVSDHTGAPLVTRHELTDLDLAGEICEEYITTCKRGPARCLDPGDEPTELIHLRWTASVAFDDLCGRLRPLADCFEDEQSIDVQTGPGGDRHALITWYRRGPLPDPDDWRAVAYLYLGEGHLAADVATATMAKAVIDEVRSRVGPAILTETRPAAAVRVHSRGCWLALPAE